MKNLQTIYKNEDHTRFKSLANVFSYMIEGVYIVWGFQSEYGGGQSEEKAILLIKKGHLTIISPSAGIVTSTDEGKTWTKVTRLASEKIGTNDLADNSVSPNKIYPAAIDSSKIAINAVTESHIINKAVTKAKLADAVVNQIDQFQMIAQGSDLLNIKLGKGVYFTNDEKYTNIPTGITGFNPMCMIVDNNGGRMLLGTSTLGDFICAKKTSGSTSWTICNYYNEIDKKQNSTDKTLTTTSKTVVGAINELNNNFVNGKAKEAQKVTNKLIVGSKSYDGSAAVSLVKSDLGLGNVDNTADKNKIVKGASYDDAGRELSTAYVNKDSVIINDEAVPCPKPYISRIHNEFAAAHKWAIVTPSGLSYDVDTSYLFDGDYDTSVTVKNTDTLTINIKFSEDGTKTYPGYPYGRFLMAFYYGGVPSAATCRVYCNYAPQGIGWHELSLKTVLTNLWKFTNNYYAISQIEFTITGNGLSTYTDGKYPTMITQIEFSPSRPSLTQPHPVLFKYMPECLYFPLTVPELIEGTTSLKNKYASKSVETTVVNKVDKVSGKGLSTNDYTADDKSKLDGIAAGATKTIVENELTVGSTNAIANGVVADKFKEIETEISGLPTTSYVDSAIRDVNEKLADKQEKLISGTNIKTINGASILGNGNITISGSGGLAPVEVTNGDIDDQVIDIEIDSGSILQFGGKMYHPHFDINTIKALKEGVKWPYDAANSICTGSCGETLSDNGDYIGMFINKIDWSLGSSGPAISGMDMLVVWKHRYNDAGVDIYIIERVNY